VLRWWDAPGGGNQVATGSSYTTNVTGSVISAWVDEEFPNGFVDFTGEATNSIGAGSMFTANDIRGLYFDVTAPVILNTVDVYSNSAGDRTIEVIDSQGNTVVDKVVSIPASPNVPYTVNLNFTLYPGVDYFIKCRGLVDLYRNSTGANYPINSSYVNITGSNAGSPGYYYFFYNWTYTEITCNTSRTEVFGTDSCFVGIADIFGERGFEVYPNPNNGRFEISFTSEQPRDFVIRITNSIGQTVSSTSHNMIAGSFRKDFDLRTLAKGIYQVEVISGDKSSKRKIVISD
jgi:hypothetical protein